MRSLFHFYLEKLATGDESVVDKLIPHLAERLIYVPLAEGQGSVTESGGSALTVRILRVEEDSRSLFPVFTTEKSLRNWCDKEGHRCESISLLGADFCTVLSSDNWLWIDPGSDKAAELKPDIVAKVKNVSIEEDEPLEPPPPKAAAPPEEAKPVVLQESEPVTLHNPIQSLQSSQDSEVAQNPELSPNIVLSETQDMGLLEASEEAKERLRKKKRKSFLGFLKTK